MSPVSGFAIRDQTECKICPTLQSFRRVQTPEPSFSVSFSMAELSRERAWVEADIKPSQASQSDVFPPTPFAIDQSRAREPAQERIESYLSLHARQRRPKTEVCVPAK